MLVCTCPLQDVDSLSAPPMTDEELLSNKALSTPPPMANQKTSFWSLLKSWGAFAFLVTVFMAGMGIANTHWSSLNATLQVELTRIRDEATKARADASKAEQALAVAKADYIAGTRRIEPQPAMQLGVLSNAAPVAALEGDRPALQESVTVPSEGSTSIFGGQLLISVAGIAFEGD